MTSLRDSLAEINPSEPTVAIVDIEGGAALLIDPVMLPRLLYCHILVEIHEFTVAGLEGLITERFAQTHTVERFEAAPRSLMNLPLAARELVSTRSEGAALTLMSEFRPANMTWLYLRPSQK